VQSLTRPNGSVTTYQYDLLNRLTQMTTTVSGSTISQYACTYNAQDLRDTESFIGPQRRAAHQYDPFGKPETLFASVTQPMGFSTKAYDHQTGLSYYGFRFYSPSLGRWITRDPLRETGGINLYAYVLNNPVNAIDPEGLVLWGQLGMGLLQAADATVMAGTAFAATVGTAALTGNVPLAALIGAEMLPVFSASAIEAIHAYHNIYDGLTDEMPLQNQPCLAK
jgi:RHS repeat-associated protein